MSPFHCQTEGRHFLFIGAAQGMHCDLLPQLHHAVAVAAYQRGTPLSRHLPYSVTPLTAIPERSSKNQPTSARPMQPAIVAPSATT